MLYNTVMDTAVKKPNVFDVLDGMITDTINHSKIKQLMKTMLKDDSDAEQELDIIPEPTTEIVGMDEVSNAFNTDSLSEKETDSLKVTMMDMMEKMTTLETENKKMKTDLELFNYGKITDITLNDVIHKLDPLTIEIVGSYKTIEKCIDENDGITYSGLNDAIINKKIYRGYYWRWMSSGNSIFEEHKIKPFVSGISYQPELQLLSKQLPSSTYNTDTNTTTTTTTNMNMNMNMTMNANNSNTKLKNSDIFNIIGGISKKTNANLRNNTNVVFSSFLERVPDKSADLNTRRSLNSNDNNTIIMRINK